MIARSVLALALVSLFFVAPRGSSAQALKADYQFRNSRSSSVAGAPDLTDLIAPGQTCPAYCNTFSPDTVDGLSWTTLGFPFNNGLAVEPSTSVLSNNGVYTIVALFKFSDVGGYKRLIEFKHGTSDNGLYLLGGTINFYPYGNGSITVAANTWNQVILTRDASGTLRGYINGSLGFTGSDSVNQYGVIDGNNSLRFFQDIGPAGGEAAAGSVARIRIYDGVLSDYQISTLDRLPAAITTPPVGMVAWLPLDAADPDQGHTPDIRSGASDQVSGEPVYQPGKVGNAMQFNGASTYIKENARADLDVGQGPGFSIDAWINPTDTGSGYRNIAEWNDGVSYGVYLYQYNSQIYFSVKDTSNTEHYFYSGQLIAGVWQHVTATYDKNTGMALVYLNGVLQGSLAVGTVTPQTSYDLYFGIRKSGNQYPFAGSMDEIEVFDRALNQNEINALFNADTKGKAKPSAVTPPAGIAGWWGLDGDSRDEAGHNLNGIRGSNDTSLPSFAVSKVGQGLSLTADGQYVEIPDVGLLHQSSFTIEGWANLTAAPTAVQSLFSKPLGSINQDSYAVWYQNGTLHAGIGADGVNAYPSGVAQVDAPSFSMNTWHHVAFTFNDPGVESLKTLTLYVDGIAVATATTTLAPVYDGHSAYIGADYDSVFGGNHIGYSWRGGLDEITFYSRSITPDEVRSIYHAGLAGKLKEALTIAPPPPVAGLSRLPAKSATTRTRTVSPGAAITVLSSPQSVAVTVGDATVTFNNVTSPGVTQEVPLDPALFPALPSGYTSTGLIYDVATDASYTGSIQTCFHDASLNSQSSFNGLHIFHLESGLWVDRTSSMDFQSQMACATTNGLSPFALGVAAPTAAKVTVSGRVLTPDGGGLRNATVMMTDTEGKVRTVSSNAFGYYSFTDVPAGGTYTFVVSAKRYTFGAKVVSVTDEIADMNFTALY